MPKVASYLLAWSFTLKTYQVEETPSQELLEIALESPAWFAWLDHISSFAFWGKSGHYTARKESRPRGEGYWYAYLGIGKKLMKRYLGKTGDLTSARLEQVAEELDTAQEAVVNPSQEASSEGRSMPASISPLVSSGAEGAGPPVALPQPSEPNTERAPLLSIKLHRPRPRSRLVSRSHLVERLQQAMECPFTLISAPAGFGKTTLLAQWLAQSGLPVAWLSLEPEDNDPVRFLTYLIAALQTVDCRLGTSALARLRTLQPSPLETVLALLTNDLMVDEAGKIALVLDDYHTITAEPIHRAVTYLLEHLPLQLHLVISTRVDPPLPLARLRARGELVERRAQNLRFSAEEVTHFLADTMELVLDADQVVQLAERTEGWVAGLQLAALALRGRADVDQFLARFSGSHRYLVDYLAEDVLRREPEPVQRFLLQTSLLERLCAPLCAALTGSSEAQALLEQAERANLFLVPLDDHREWYRYHALFAEFLQERLRQAFPGEGETLHRRAAQWFEQQELIPEAVQHALAGADYERAVRLVTQSARAFLLRGETATLRTWLQALPEDLLRARPRLCMILGNELSTAGEFEAADVWLRAAETRLRAGESCEA